jgi:hypothetical protein
MSKTPPKPVETDEELAAAAAEGVKEAVDKAVVDVDLKAVAAKKAAEAEAAAKAAKKPG